MKKSSKKILTLVALVILLVTFLRIDMLPIALGDSDRDTFVVHFYNGDNEYRYDEWEGKQNVTWGAYYWIDIGRTSPSSGKDPDFAREGNTGETFTIKLTPTESAAVRSGKKLGLIMVRCYVDETNVFTPYWNGNKGKDITADRFVTVNFDATNTAHVWIIAGDKNNYESLEQAKMAFESIQSARFDDFSSVIAHHTSPVTTDTGYRIFEVTDAVNNPDGTLVDSGKVNFADPDGKYCDLRVNLSVNWNADYLLHLDGYVFPRAINKTRLMLSDRFRAECIPADADGDGEVDVPLGCEYTSVATTFRLWAPVSTDVAINFYKSGDETDDTLARSSVLMTLTQNGVFEAQVEGNLNGVYYTYTNYVEGEAVETADPYATACGINGNRSMVCDLASTDPDNWTADETTAQRLRDKNTAVPVIWEIHVRDFSISPDSGITHKGKYLAFTEQNTHAKGNSDIKTGIAYLKELGVNYVHLNPVYDFATVDEQYNNNVNYRSAQNWGYDPKNYNVPEGSYATNAENGQVRVNEFKQMVRALHEAGIGVILDVVYNHTYTSDSFFNKAVPGYYYRQELSGATGTFGKQSWTVNSLGNYNLSDGSGCGNETASEREMFRSYIVSSVKYWVNEYHIDGFRFDLMGCHDVDTMNYVRRALNALPGGQNLLLYGEPWAAARCGIDPSYNVGYANTANLGYLDAGIKVFNSKVREAIKGNNSPSGGFVNGNVGMLDNLNSGLRGGMWDYPHEDAGKSVLYTTSHDNYTLWDQLVYTTARELSPTLYSEGTRRAKLANMMAAAMTLTGKGTSFILAGEEIARTKYGNHNSYNAQDKINALDYYRMQRHKDLFDWYKGLIELRTKRFTAFADANVTSWGENYNSACFSFGCDRIRSTDEYDKVMVVYNAGSSACRINFTDSWQLIGNSYLGVINFDGIETVGNGIVTVPAYTTFILARK